MDFFSLVIVIYEKFHVVVILPEMKLCFPLESPFQISEFTTWVGNEHGIFHPFPSRATVSSSKLLLISLKSRGSSSILAGARPDHIV